MKQLLCVILTVLGLVTTAPTSETSDAEIAVTAAASGLFPAGAGLGSLAVESVDLGAGVFINSQGSATGTFHAVLAAESLLGQQQQIAVDGRVTAGASSGDNTTFSGTATLDLGDGTPLLPAVPFSVTLTADGVALTIDSMPLPPAGITAGSMTIE